MHVCGENSQQIIILKHLQSLKICLWIRLFFSDLNNKRLQRRETIRPSYLAYINCEDIWSKSMLLFAKPSFSGQHADAITAHIPNNNNPIDISVIWIVAQGDNGSRVHYRFAAANMAASLPEGCASEINDWMASKWPKMNSTKDKTYVVLFTISDQETQQTICNCWLVNCQSVCIY